MHNGEELFPDGPGIGEDEDEGGLTRMSILDHLEELRNCIISALWGFGLIFVLCAIFSNQIFDVVLAPGLRALKDTGIPGADRTVLHHLGVDAIRSLAFSGRAVDSLASVELHFSGLVRA